MITTQQMTTGCLALYKAGDILVDAAMLRDRLYRVTLRKIPCMSNEIPNVVRDAVREKFEREIDDRFPGKIVSTVLGNGNNDDNESLIAVGVSQLALDIKEDLLAHGIPTEGRVFNVNGNERKIVPGDLLPGRSEGPAMGLLFFPEVACEWGPILAAYYAKRTTMTEGMAKSYERLKQKKARIAAGEAAQA